MTRPTRAAAAVACAVSGGLLAGCGTTSATTSSVSPASSPPAAASSPSASASTSTSTSVGMPPSSAGDTASPPATTSRAATPPPAEHDVACRTATVAARAGQLLRLTGCPVVAYAETPAGQAVLTRTGKLEWRAATPGTTTIDVSRGVPCPSGQPCSHLRAQQATLRVVVSD